MIVGKSTKHGAGIIIHGDYYDLVSLHDALSELTEDTIHGPTLQEFAMGLGKRLKVNGNGINLGENSLGVKRIHISHLSNYGRHS